MSPPRLAAEIRVAALIRRAEIAGAAGVVARRGADGAGAIALKLTRLDRRPHEACARALIGAQLGDGRAGWAWLVGPDWAEDVTVEAALARQAAFDSDLWIVAIDDRDGRHFLDEPIG